MERHLRLADRRGLLTGHRLSQAQELGVEVLLVLEMRLRAEDFMERFKMALVTANPLLWTNKVFPDLIGGTGTEEVEEGAGEKLTDFDPAKTDGVVYQFPDMTEEERQELVSELARQANWTATENDFEDAGWE